MIERILGSTLIERVEVLHAAFIGAKSRNKSSVMSGRLIQGVSRCPTAVDSWDCLRHDP